ncbi:MAG: hypothetical protein EBX40_06525, partial [Gammaproteobacteria bacterium]|nr:hypothetical protein [Gammaproteobacteria bacterium]
AYAHHTPASVWGLGSIHGRQDDLSSDFTQFNHKNVLVVDSNHRLNPNTFTPYFQRTEHRVLFLNSEPVDLWLGYDFHEPLYQTQVLCSLETMYYSLPAWLPRSTHWFEEKYHCHLHH